MTNIRVKEVYMPPRCSCGERPIVEHEESAEAMIRRAIPSRVRCPGCGKKTQWRQTRFQAEIAWEEHIYDDTGD